jgi:sugar-specific transcriptional regulator TrmB
MVENLLSVVSSLEEIFEEAKSEEMPQRGTIWTISGRHEILGKIREMLSKAKHSVSLITNEKGMVLLYRSFNRLFDELSERSIKVSVMTPTDSIDGHILNELGYSCEVQETNFQLPLIFLCADKKQLLLASLQPNDFSLNSDHDRGVFSDNPVLREMICLLVWGERAPLLFSL